MPESAGREEEPGRAADPAADPARRAAHPAADPAAGPAPSVTHPASDPALPAADPPLPAALPACIALIGFMGSGKSTVGRLLAQKLGRPFLDLDSLIAERAGKSIREIFDRDGEEAFRRLETEALYGLQQSQHLVLAVGGGAPIRAENRRFFRELAQTFYLEISFAEFRKRTGRDRSRPLLDCSRSELKRLYDARLPVYRELGRPIAAGSRTPLQIAAEILEVLGRA